ncbi:MAG: 50S ribosomal protein L13 [Bacteroidota bacterium]
MDHNSFKTFSAKPAEVERRWLVIDGENQVVGRLAAQVATLLRGKHKPTYTPHVDTGDFVVIVNADKVRFTGKKETAKQYFRHSGYPGGATYTTPKEYRQKKPTFIVENAVRGMLPKTKLGRQMIKKLKVYAGPEHPHDAQQPESFDLNQ